ncbi:PTS transporter subunit IIBC [Cetobacterium sp. SF1]|uniref:PTS transporter subunit IIBC n=1 Tax=Cetobacterium sp. SF1 TaxID=3417654 RepID=UPI003CEB54DD
MKKFKLGSFDFWQKFGKALLVVIAVMPAAGLMISVGKLLGGSFDLSLLKIVGRVMEDIGWGIIVNLHILFAVAIGGSWAKDRSGGAFAALLSFILINRITGSIFHVNEGMLNDSNGTIVSLTGQTLLVKDYFKSILGAPALNMGVFVGIISGFMGATLYNKYYSFEKLPKSLAFFNGKRFVPFMVVIGSTIMAVILAYIWPFVQWGLNSFGQWIATSKDTAPIVAPFLYGTLERLLLPFGLHHMLTIPMNYTELGGTYKVLTGAEVGKTIAGQDPIWFAWITDLNNFKNAGDMVDYKELLATVVPARFKVGQVILSNASLLGIALAMYKNVDEEKKNQYKTIFISAGLAVFLTGVTEPLEFMFMFIAPVLYGIYAVLAGLSFAVADLIHLRIQSFGMIELLTRTPLMINAGLGGDLINFLLVSTGFFLLNYFVANFIIQKFNVPTPGRLGNYIDKEEDHPSENKVEKNKNTLAQTIISLLGGRDNIEDVDACMTRLRVTVRDNNLVAEERDWKSTGSIGLIIKGNGVQAIYGPKADTIKSNIQDLLGI